MLGSLVARMVNCCVHVVKAPGVLSKCLYREVPPQGPTITLLYTIFHEKGTPFVYILLTNGTLFTYLF